MGGPKGQRLLLEKFVADIPTWDIRQFHHTAQNVIESVELKAQAGIIDMEKLAKIGEQLDLPGLEHVENDR